MSYESEARVESILAEIRKSKEGYLDSDDFKGTVNLIRRLNTESAHFIWELLQNAEDARAERIFFTLEKDKLTVKHTDGKVFSASDVWAICRIGVSSKAKDANKIGKFGVGFKSVFNYTDSPYIYSKDFRFRIEKFVYPTSLPKPIGKGYGDATVFILPFNNPKKPCEKAYSDIKEKLLSLSTSSLLFLKSIGEITVNIEGEVFTIKRSIHRKVKIADHLFLEEIELKDRNETKKYYRFTLDDLTLEDEGDDGTPEVIENQSVMISYRLDGNGNIRRISSTSDLQNFFVFFPTKIESHLEYLVHAPFSTSSNRETITADSQANEILYDAIADLVGKSFLYLVQEKKVTTAFYDEILLETESSVLHERIRNRLSGIILEQQKVLPTFNGNYASLDELLVFSESNLGTEEVGSLKSMFSVPEISDNSAKQFWDDKYAKTKIPAFLHACPAYNETRDEIHFNQFVKSLTADCLESKPVAVINKLYEHLAQYWEKLSRFRSLNYNYGYKNISVESEIVDTAPLIRNTDNKHIFANTKGLYLQNVHPEILKNETSHIILQRYFKIKEYDEKEDIKVRILGKYSSPNVNVSLDENVDDLLTISNAILKRVIYYKDIADSYLILSRNAKTNRVGWNRSYSVFQTQNTGSTSEYAEVLLAGIPYLNFLDEGYEEYVKSGIISWEHFGRLNVKDELCVMSYERAHSNLFSYTGNGSEVDSYHAKMICGLEKAYSEIQNFYINRYGDNEFEQIKKSPEGKQLSNVALSISPMNDFEFNRFIPYLDDILMSIRQVSDEDGQRKSLLLYRLLSESGNVLKGEISWKRKNGKYEATETTIYSELGNRLKDRYWVYDKNGQLHAPSELNPESIADAYRQISESVLSDLLQASGKRPTVIIEGDDPGSKELQTQLSNFFATDPEAAQKLKKFMDGEEEKSKKSISASLQSLNRESSDYERDDEKLRHPSPVSNVERRTNSLETALSEIHTQGGENKSQKKVVYRTVEYESSESANNEKEKAFLWGEYGGVCQICSEQIPIYRGSHRYPYYFVARQLIPSKNLDSAYQKTTVVDGWNSLSLCPNCAAKIRYSQMNIDTVEEQIEGITISGSVSKPYEIRIILDNKEEVITYTPKHILALKTALAFFKKLESQN